MVYGDGTREYTGDYHGFAEIVLRGTMFGSVAGLVCGAAVGTVLLPLIGTLIGGLYGVMVGACLGLPCALVLGLVSWARPSVVVTRIVSIAVAMGWGALAVVCSVPGEYGGFAYVAFPLGAIAAAVVGPMAVHRRAERPRRLPPTEPKRALR